MKYLAFIMFLIPFSAVSAGLEGYKTPQAAIDAITGPLKKGSKGVSDSMKAADSLNGDNQSSSKFQQIGSSLTKDLKDNGKVVKTRVIDSDERLGGKMQTITYEMEYLNGKKRQVQVRMIKPSENSGFHIMNMELDP